MNFPAKRKTPCLLPRGIFYPLLVLLALVILGLMNREEWRVNLLRAGEAMGAALRRLFFDLPVAIVRIPALRRLVASWPFQLLYWYVVKPLFIWLLLYLCAPHVFGTALWGGLAFIGAHMFLNSRPGRAVHDLIEPCNPLYRAFSCCCGRD